MGRMLGSFADNNELDRPDLNKCPDCQGLSKSTLVGSSYSSRGR